MTMQAEMTYDQIIAEANNEIRDCDARLAQLKMKKLGSLADGLSGILRDGPTLSSLADWDDSVQQEIRAVQEQKDHAQAVRDGLQRNHGAMNEAHQSAPVQGAQPEFYEG